MKELAIVIPGYNCEKYIKKCLDSIIYQMSENMDIIFVDDGSNDNTAELVKNTSQRIIYIYQENAGVSSARNTALKMAKDYKYIMFVDADDWLEKGCLQNLLQSAKKADYVFCDWNEYKVKEQKVFVEHLKVNDRFDESVTVDDLRCHFFRSRSGGSPWGKIYNNDIINKYRISFIEGLPYAEDYLFNLMYLKYALSVCYIPKALYAYNCMQDGARAKFRKNRVDMTIQIERIKWDLYTVEDQKKRILMEAELVEQMAVAGVNLYDKRFKREERKKEQKKIRMFLRKKHLGIKEILKTEAKFKAKLICVVLFII